MSQAKPGIILNRIASALPESKIAVFKTNDPDQPLDAVFENTIETQKRIAAGDPALIGVYDRNSDPDTVKMTLMSHSLKSEPGPNQDSVEEVF